VILPTKPAMPRHKGKVEAGVKYVQDNGLAGKQFDGLGAQNVHLAHWEETVADTRIHGTTRQQVRTHFLTVEKPKLLPLPAGLFPVFSEAPRKVHRDGYMEVDKAYYSVPPEYVRRGVWARWDVKMVRVFNERMEAIAVHVRQEPGKFKTDPAHTRYLFEPKSLHEAAWQQVRQDMQRHGLSKKFNADCNTWRTVGITFFKKWGGDPRAFLADCQWDAPTVLERLRSGTHLNNGRQVPDFPFLRGNKIGPLWVRMLRDNVGLEIKNLGAVPIPVDVHVARATLAVGIVRGWYDGDLEGIYREIRLAWRESVKGLRVDGREMIALDVDEALWHLSKYGCTDRDQATGECPHYERCEARELCVRGKVAGGHGGGVLSIYASKIITSAAAAPRLVVSGQRAGSPGSYGNATAGENGRGGRLILMCPTANSDDATLWSTITGSLNAPVANALLNGGHGILARRFREACSIPPSAFRGTVSPLRP
jgi:hypothetical protein